MEEWRRQRNDAHVIVAACLDGLNCDIGAVTMSYDDDIAVSSAKILERCHKRLGSLESRLLPKAGTPAEREDVGFADRGINRLDQRGRSAYPPWIPVESAMHEHNTGRRLATFLDWRQTDHPVSLRSQAAASSLATDQTKLGYHVEVRAQDDQLFRSGTPSVKDAFGRRS